MRGRCLTEPKRQGGVAAARLALGLCAGLMLSACVEIQQAADRTGRTAAKSAVTEAIYTRFPQVPKELVAPFTDCIVDNATGPEIAALAQDAIVGVDGESAEMIRTILSRPATARCLTAVPLKPGQTI